MKKVKMIVFLVVIAMSVLCFGVKEKDEKKSKRKPKHYSVNAAVFYPLSINKSKYDSADVNLSLFYGRIDEVRGFDFSCFVSAVGDEMRGVQLTGLASVTGDTMKGVQMSGIVNVAGDTVKGLQAAGIGNVAGDTVKGVQASGIFNIAGDKVRGIQGSAIFNITGEDFKGIQGTGIFNITGEDFTGIQGADIFNIVGENFTGVQGSGIFNITGENFSGLQGSGILNVTGGTMRGVQLGVVNVAGKSRGVQLGIVNYAKKNLGVPVGIVNIAQNGRIRMTAWGSNVSAFNLGAKFIVGHVYSIVSVGGNNIYKDISNAVSYGFFYGVHFPFRKMFFDMDAGYMTLDNDKFFKSIEGDRDQHVLMLRGALGFDITRKFSVFAGGGLHYSWDHGRDVEFNSGEAKPMFFAGIELF